MKVALNSVTVSKYLHTVTLFPCPEGVTVTEDVFYAVFVLTPLILQFSLHRLHLHLELALVDRRRGKSPAGRPKAEVSSRVRTHEQPC